MRNVFCLGRILIKFPSTSTVSPSDIPQVSFLQKGNLQAHLLVTNCFLFGDLSKNQSHFVGPFLGPVGGCSTQITEAQISCSNTSLIKLQGFVVSKTPTLSQLQECVFSQSKAVTMVDSAFSNSGSKLHSIWN